MPSSRSILRIMETPDKKIPGTEKREADGTVIESKDRISLESEDSAPIPETVITGLGIADAANCARFVIIIPCLRYLIYSANLQS